MDFESNASSLKCFRQASVENQKTLHCLKGLPEVMNPEQVAESYDQLADQWLEVSRYGFDQIERAIAFTTNRGVALDVGCGTGRMFELLTQHGFRIDGIELSSKMIGLAKERNSEARLFHDDISRWNFPQSYDLILAWDSIWHVPLDQQECVLRKLCRGLSSGGVFIFTTGGLDEPTEKQDSCMGPLMYNSVLGISRSIQVLVEAGCKCRHLEYDQHRENHVYIIVQKT